MWDIISALDHDLPLLQKTQFKTPKPEQTQTPHSSPSPPKKGLHNLIIILNKTKSSLEDISEYNCTTCNFKQVHSVIY